jgi:hypothetical protein
MFLSFIREPYSPFTNIFKPPHVDPYDTIYWTPYRLTCTVFPRPSIFMRPSSEPKAVVLAQRSSLVLYIVPARAVNRRRRFAGTRIAANSGAPSIR